YTQTPITSALSSAVLEQFASYPNNLHSIEGYDIYTGDQLTVALSTAGKEYHCKTCNGTINLAEENVVVWGIESVRSRDGFVLDHHHMHWGCFHNNEFRYWYDSHLIARGITTAIAKQSGWQRPATIAA